MVLFLQFSNWNFKCLYYNIYKGFITSNEKISAFKFGVLLLMCKWNKQFLSMSGFLYGVRWCWSISEIICQVAIMVLCGKIWGVRLLNVRLGLGVLAVLTGHVQSLINIVITGVPSDKELVYLITFCNIV